MYVLGNVCKLVDGTRDMSRYIKDIECILEMKW